MRIVVWNVAKRWRHNREALSKLAPNVAILPEVPESVGADETGSTAWCGRDPAVGLGVVGFGGVRVERLGPPEPAEVWVMPVRVTGPRTFTLLAVWADNSPANLRSAEGQDPMGPLRRALRTYRRTLGAGPTVVAGDFNNNVRFDRPFRALNHGYAVADLSSLGLVSADHRHRRCEQGTEPEPTYYSGRQAAKADHLDHVFVPRDWSVVDVGVGSYDDYCTKGRPSDHAPLIVDCTPPILVSRSGRRPAR